MRLNTRSPSHFIGGVFLSAWKYFYLGERLKLLNESTFNGCSENSVRERILKNNLKDETYSFSICLSEEYFLCFGQSALWYYGYNSGQIWHLTLK